MKYLIVDIGNSRTKVSMYQDTEFLFEEVVDSGEELKASIYARYSKADAAIISSVSSDSQSVKEVIEAVGVRRVLVFGSDTPIPLTNLYKTPQTLGVDRLAVAVAASERFPKSDILVVDMGTAITIDYVSKEGEYLGGSISPGLEMRLKALRYYTRRLPELSGEELYSMFERFDITAVADDTKSAMFNGVVRGIVEEIEGYIRRGGQKNVYFSGGDAIYFEKLINFPTFANYRAVSDGLRSILEKECLRG